MSLKIKTHIQQIQDEGVFEASVQLDALILKNILQNHQPDYSALTRGPRCTQYVRPSVCPVPPIRCSRNRQKRQKLLI